MQISRIIRRQWIFSSSLRCKHCTKREVANSGESKKRGPILPHQKGLLFEIGWWRNEYFLSLHVSPTIGAIRCFYQVLSILGHNMRVLPILRSEPKSGFQKEVFPGLVCFQCLAFTKPLFCLSFCVFSRRSGDMAMRGVYTLRKPLGLCLRIRQAALIRIRLSENRNRIWQECQEHQAADTTRFAMLERPRHNRKLLENNDFKRIF